MQGRWRRALGAIRRAGLRRLGAPTTGRLLTLVACLVAGLMITTGALASRGGGDLRPDRNTDLVDLVRAEATRNAELTARLAQLRTEVDALAASQDAGDPLAAKLDDLALQTGMTPVTGPAVTVTLSDAPLDVKPPGVDEDLLIVHQQDIQAVVNALWSGDAEAMTVQGQRVTSTTGIKCVGSTVVLHGVPYAPPYVITAVGDPQRLTRALAESRYLAIYQQYVDAYGLGYSQTVAAEAALPGYQGSLELSNARPVR